MGVEEKVYLHYTQADLDRNFDQRGWVSNALEVIGRYPVLSAATRSRLKHDANLSYGPSPDEVLDVFPTGKRHAPTQIFVHGGAWRNFTKDDYSFAAETFVSHGVNAVILNFAKLPSVRLPDMVAQIQRAIAWVYRHAAQWSGDPDRIYLSGQSSGAHLAAAALTWRWPSPGLPESAIRGAHLISGCYDLEPVLLSARSSYIKLSKTEEHELSPQRHAGRMHCPVFIGYAECDTDEFQRQSREFAAALAKAGRLNGTQRFPDLTHFEIVEAFRDPESALANAVIGRMSCAPRRPASTFSRQIRRRYLVPCQPFREMSKMIPSGSLNLRSKFSFSASLPRSKKNVPPC
jgi:arylformamidase